MKRTRTDTPKFANEAQEANWWASREGREFVIRKSAEAPKTRSTPNASRLVGQLNQIAREARRP
jgi:hypothetical protein